MSLRIYSILRADLNLPPGKAAAKAVQAAINAAQRASPDTIQQYLSDGEGTQIILMAEDEVELRSLHIQACEQGLPCVLYEEALGIGPCLREAAHPITKRLKMM